MSVRLNRIDDHVALTSPQHETDSPVIGLVQGARATLMVDACSSQRHAAEVRRELPPEVEVWIDTGIMSGADIVAAIACGANFTLVGRAYLYGLMAGGRRGVDRAIQILSDEVARTMKLLGVRSVDELEPGHVTLLDRPG